MPAHSGVGFLADAGQLPAELGAFRPTILLAVPRVLEKAAAAARAGGLWRPVTAGEFAGRVASVAAGLIAGGSGPVTGSG